MSPLPRDPIPYPNWLRIDEQRVWDRLNSDYAPYVLTDAFGETSDAPPPVSLCGWWSLYATALMWMGSAFSHDGFPPEKPSSDGYRPAIVDEFWKLRAWRLNRFRKFLSRWRLASTFRVGLSTHERVGEPVVDEDQDECVLWFHSFQNLKEVQQYALSWASNPHFKSSALKSHRLVVSRGIDLVCSELLANGFEHSAGSTVFILAKLCSVASARAALAADSNSAILTAQERDAYLFSAHTNAPLLQLVIGDRGPGFLRNARLRSLYDSFDKTAKTTPDFYSESDLIEFALRPEVSSKDRDDLTRAWKTYFNEESIEAYKPVVHGLSEVRVYVEEHRGRWRIHSGGMAVDVDGSGGGLTRQTVRPIQGCLHYIQLPLVTPSGSRPLPTARFSKRSRFRDLRPLDVGATIHDPASRLPTGGPIVDRVQRFCQTILDHDDTDVALVVNLLSLSQLKNIDPAEQLASLALIADTLHRTRRDIGVFLIADELVRSMLRRFRSTSLSFFDRRVFVYLDPFGTKHAVHLDAGAEVKTVEQLLQQALDPWSDQTVLRSDVSEVWAQLGEILAHNRGLFTIVDTGTGDEAFEGRLKVTGNGEQSAGPLLLGGRSFSSLAVRLADRRGVLAWDDRMPYWFRGRPRPTHLNLGRLLGDQEFVSDLVAWFAAAARSMAHATETDPSELVFIALLHPAIGIAQELVRTHFPKADLFEIGSLGELCVESWQFADLSRRRVICVTDMVVTGQTMTELQEAIRYVGGAAIGILSILSMSDHRLSGSLFSFTECDIETLRRNVRRRDKSDSPSVVRMVDANSQFTQPILGTLMETDARAAALTNAGALVIAHRVFGGNHHVASVLVRAILDRRDLTDSICEDLKAQLEASHPPGGFSILYPGESTISYFIHQNEEFLPGNKCIALVPTFRGYGQHSLVLDRAQDMEPSAKSNNVLFIDDSLSSGTTERNARVVWRRTMGNDPRSWMTYVILRRGSFETDRAVETGPKDGRRQSYSSRHYCSIGPRSYAAGACVLCAALERAKEAHKLIEPLDNGACRLLEVVVGRLSVAPLEGHSDASLLPPSHALDFLRLAGNPIWESANYLRHGSPEHTAGCAFYVAVYARDLAAYLSTADIVNVVASAAAAVDDDDEAQVRFLVAVALLPLNCAHALIEPALKEFVRVGAHSVATAFVALVFQQTAGTLKRFEMSGMPLNDVQERLLELRRVVDTVISTTLADTDASLLPAGRVVQLEVNSIASPTGTGNTVQLARTLSALFYDGSHTTLLLPQLDRLTVEVLPQVSQNLLNAISVLEQFCALTVMFAPSLLQDARARITQATEALDCEGVRTGAGDVIEYWNLLKNRYFHSPHDLRRAALAGLTDANESVRDIEGSYFWFVVEEPPAAAAGWYLLGPERKYLKDHFRNLFSNTSKHASPDAEALRQLGAAAMRSTGDGRLGRLTWRINEPARALDIVYSQSVPFRKQTPSGRGFMATTSAHLSVFGGSIVIPAHGQSDTAIAEVGPFVEVCVTRMPLVLELPR